VKKKGGWVPAGQAIAGLKALDSEMGGLTRGLGGVVVVGRSGPWL
jgi:hypothetical protein